MSAQTGSSFIALDIPTEHPTIIDFPLVEEFPSNLSVSQSLKIEASGSEDNFILGFVKEYDSGSLNLQIESQRNVNSGSFSDWTIVKTMGGLSGRTSKYRDALERNEDLIKIFTSGNPTKSAFDELLGSADLPSVGSFEKLNEDFTRFTDPEFILTMKQDMIDGFLKCYKEQSKLPPQVPVDVACFLKGACLAKVIHKFAQLHLSVGDSTLPNLKLPPGMPAVPPGVTTAPQSVIKGTDKGPHIGKPIFLKPAIEILLGLAFVITNRKSQRPGFTIEQAREVQATEFAKALKNYFKLTLVVGVNNHNNAMFTPGTAISGVFNGSTTSTASVFPLTGFSVAIGKISNPELTDDPLKNFIEDYKEMMKEQAETKPGTTIEVSQLKMAKRVASALIKLFNSIEIEGNHFAPLMLSLPGVQSAFGTIPAPTGVAPSPATIVAPFPPIPGTNKGQFGVKVGKGKLIP